ncbi:MAG TPA: phage holin family protein [Candidatus Limnocylindrales bacterium]|nr:phage holin family protein [Candidatus Limnocylindrales bacterium]
MLKRLVVRILISLVTSLPAVLFAAWILPGFTVNSIGSAIAGIAVLSILNAFIRPVLVRFTLPLSIFTVGLFTLIIDGLMIVAVQEFARGWYVQNVLTGIFISFILTLVQLFIANAIISENDRDLFFYEAIQRNARKSLKQQKEFDSPGLLMLEIDGLSEPILHKALAEGLMPHLKAMLDSGEYKLVEWDSGLQSQTSAMQAGILHGTHFNIPAFRFYNKVEGRLYVSNHARDASAMLRAIEDGKGVLGADGFSLNNWGTGDAGEVMLTFASGDAGVKMLGPSNNLFQFFANFNNVQRVLAGTVADLWREYWQARYQRNHDVQPRVSRSFPYPLVRAATTVLLPFLSVYLLLGKMFEGIGTVYTTFVSYDEVAHHSGIDRPDAMKVLVQLDGQIRQILNARPFVNRRYEVLLLSDHGQTMGATFLQRYGLTLGELVDKLLGSKAAILEQLGGDEAVANINMLASHLTHSDRWAAKRLRNLTRRVTDEEGMVEILKSSEKKKALGDADSAPRTNTVVVASGNLGLIYFTHWTERLTLEQMSAEFPGLVIALASHPGIGFVVVRSADLGLVALSGEGSVYYLDEDRFEGASNPLANFGPNAARHLRELDTYPCMPDILVNSFYDPVKEEGAAFEELVGFHGGLGGEQNRPFLMYPARLQPDVLPPIIGAPGVYHVIRRWQEQMRGTGGANVAKDVRPTVGEL